MYAITGITGRIGGGVARALLAAKQSVRAVVRDIDKGAAWTERGCEVSVADMNGCENTRGRIQGSGRCVRPASSELRPDTWFS